MYLSNCPDGGIGRHKGFKIPRLMGVRVRHQIVKKSSFLAAFFMPEIKTSPVKTT